MKTKTLDARRVFSLIGGLALVVGLVGCGGSDSGPTAAPTPTPTPPPPPPTVVRQGGGSLAADEGVQLPFTTTATGTLDVTVDWTFAANDIDAILTRGNCSVDQLLAMQCNVALVADSATAKPERLRLPGATAGAYTLFIVNVGPGDESASYQIVLTPSASSASAGPMRTLELPAKVRHVRGCGQW